MDFINGSDCFVSLPTGYGKSCAMGFCHIFLMHLGGRRDPYCCVCHHLCHL